ncbi:MAG: hypothetical protein ACYCU0_00060 [Solirubrobacteraceae bacterium]
MATASWPRRTGPTRSELAIARLGGVLRDKHIPYGDRGAVVKLDQGV